MKICFIAELPQAKMGGAEIQCYMLAKNLARKGHEIHYICYRKMSPVHNEFKVHWIRGMYTITDPIQHVISLFSALNDANCDIYLETCPRLATGLVASFCKARGRVFIYRAASLKDADLNFSRKLGWPDVPWYFKIAYRFGIRAADIIVCNSVRVAEEFSKLGRRALVIPNGHPIEPLTEPPEKDDFILWVARLAKIKRPGLLIKIASRLPQYRFIMVGEGGHKFPKLPDNVRFLGFKTGEELKELYKHASILLITSLVEGFPNTLIEAGIYYTPCVSFYDPDNVIKKYELGYVVDNLDDAVQAIRRLMENSTVRARMGANIRRYVERNHDIKKTVEAYERLFHELLSKT